MKQRAEAYSTSPRIYSCPPLNGNCAIPAEGFVFGGWYLDDKLLSNDESYEATIEYNGTSPVTLNYEARFTVA